MRILRIDLDSCRHLYILYIMHKVPPILGKLWSKFPISPHEKHLPFLHTTLEQKCGGGVRFLKYLTGLVHIPPLDSVRCYTRGRQSQRLHSGRTASSFVGCILREISDTKPRGIEATRIISGDRGQPHLSLYCEHLT